MTRNYFETNKVKLEKKMDATFKEIQKSKLIMNEEEFKTFEDSKFDEAINLNMALADIYDKATKESWWSEYIEDENMREFKHMRRHDRKRWFS